jgi:NAD(P)-dependent dehydrogenase (short-subunit alcohol dehydrogenase family)
LILGASSGFGGATAVECARHGINVIGVHLDRGAGLAACEAVQNQIRDLGAEAHYFNMNAADPAQRATMLDAVEALFREREGATLRILMHSLAFGSLKPFVAAEAKDELTQAQIEMTMNVMANSLIYWTQDVVRRGLMTHGGRIYAMTSSGSHRVLPMYGAVSAAKAALESYCRQLAFELGPRGITANAIQAGVTVTPALNKIPGSDEIIQHAMERNPLRRLTTPEDVARAIVLFASDHASWINGTVLRLDGGEDVVELNWTDNGGNA